MKKLIVTTMALALMAAPALAYSPQGTNTSGQNQINVGNTTGTITNGGNYAATYGASSVGAVSSITVVNDDVHAPTFNAGLGAGDHSFTGASTTSIGANTYYDRNFGGSIKNLDAQVPFFIVTPDWRLR